MRAEPDPNDPRPAIGPERGHRVLRRARLAVALAAICGLGLLIDAVRKSSATYDEVTYLRVAARWWRTGDQDGITRMGSPLTFWKLQQVPVLWALDHTGHRALVDDPIGHQQELLPLVRLWSLWIWLMALLADCGLEPPALRTARDGPGGLALRAGTEPAGPRRTRDHGAAAAGVYDGDVLPVLAVPPDRLPPPFLGDGRAGRAVVVVQVHHGAGPPDPRPALVGR